MTPHSCRRYERFCRLGSGLIQAVRLISRDHSVLDPEDRVCVVLIVFFVFGLIVTSYSCDCVSDGEELSLQIMLAGDAQHAPNRHLPPPSPQCPLSSLCTTQFADFNPTNA